MKIFIDILRSKICNKFLEISQTSFSGIYASEESKVNMFFTADKLILFEDVWLDGFEVASIEHFHEIVSMKVRNIAIVP